MTVNVKTVGGRRSVQYKTLDDVVSDAEQLVVAADTKTIGNWPLGHLIAHLALTVNNSIDGFAQKAPLIIRLIGPLLKKGMLKKMSPGIKLPKASEAEVFPQASPEEALLQLRSAVERTKTEPMLAAHPAFGKMTHNEWERLHLRHSEMHLSFAIPPN